MNKNKTNGLFGKKAMTAIAKLARLDYEFGNAHPAKFNTDDLQTVNVAKKKVDEVVDSLEHLWNDGNIED